MTTQPRRSAWFRGVVKPGAEDMPLPAYAAPDPELGCMTVLLDEIERLEAHCGVVARDRVLRWLTERMDQRDRERAAQAREID